MLKRAYLIIGIGFGVGAVFSSPLLAVSLLCILLDAIVNSVLPKFDNLAAIKKFEDRLVVIERRGITLGSNNR